MSVRLLVNPRADRPGRLAQQILTAKGLAEARSEIAGWEGYRPTPLADLQGLAVRLGLGRLWFKDEGQRFKLKSFKALGGPYAIARLVAREGASPDRTFASATDGNHGRAVAWGAARAGCRSVIFVPAAVSDGRAAAIAAFGAKVVRTRGTYDEAVAECAATARREGWTVIADTSEDEQAEVPGLVMEGYMVAVAEAAEQMSEVPTHVFVQAGVGGLAAAVAAHFDDRWGAGRPRLVIVEPETAACLMLAAETGGMAQVAGDLETVMGGLSCGIASAPAWRVLDAAVDAFLAIEDARAIEAMRVLADGEPAIVAGESGAAGLGGLLAVAAEEGMRRQLGLDGASRVLLFGTEGDTDPDLYTRLVGRSADAVRAGA